MNTPTRDDLLGYVLGALDADEHNRIDQCLQACPELLLEIQRIKARNQEIRSVLPAPQLPIGLARRTCEQVARTSRAAHSQTSVADSSAMTTCGDAPAVEAPFAGNAPATRRLVSSAAMVCCAAFLGALCSPLLSNLAQSTPSTTLAAMSATVPGMPRERPFITSQAGPDVWSTGQPDYLPIAFRPTNRVKQDSYSLFELSRQWQDLNQMVAHDLRADALDYSDRQDLARFSIDPLIESSGKEYPMIEFVSQ